MLQNTFIIIQIYISIIANNLQIFTFNSKCHLHAFAESWQNRILNRTGSTDKKDLIILKVHWYIKPEKMLFRRPPESHIGNIVLISSGSTELHLVWQGAAFDCCSRIDLRPSAIYALT